MLHLVVDILGSDSTPAELLEGVIVAANQLKGEAQFTVLATSEEIANCNQVCLEPSLNVNFKEVQEEVSMEDSPLFVVRRKHHSSLAVGMRMLKNKECDAFITAGNTGAVTAFATLELDKLPFIDRPALLASLPTEKGKVAILDVGANVTFRPQYLMQFALMGALFQRVTSGIKSPKIGLLNIGGEARKGTRIVRQAYDYFNHYAERLEEQDLFFEGNIEARDVFEGKVDVLVTDGFTGNVFLKTCEGVSSFIVDQITSRFLNLSSSYPTSELKQLEKYIDYAEYPGAIMLGVEGVVVKCHGCSSPKAFSNGIKGAYNLAKNQIIGTMKKHLNKLQSELSELTAS